jgi:DNA invertase Pin-like site-specific DNA recombinase
MLVLYRRESLYGTSLVEQGKMALAFGIDTALEDAPVYTDRLPGGRKAKKLTPADLTERDALIRIVRPGWVVLVSDLSRLGLSTEDILTTIEALSMEGASVQDVSTNTTYRWHPEAASLIAAAARATKELLRERTKPGLIAIERATVKRGPKGKRLSPEKSAAAEADWRDPAYESGDEVAAKWGVSREWMYDHFGARNLPAGASKRASQK